MTRQEPRQARVGHDGSRLAVLRQRGRGQKEGGAEFEKRLAELEIRQIVARVRHPQTNGKQERLHGEMRRSLPEFEAALMRKSDPTDLFTKRYNYERPHMSLRHSERETPWQTFQRKMPPAGGDRRGRTDQGGVGEMAGKNDPHYINRMAEWKRTSKRHAAERKPPSRMRQKRNSPSRNWGGCRERYGHAGRRNRFWDSASSESSRKCRRRIFRRVDMLRRHIGYLRPCAPPGPASRCAGENPKCRGSGKGHRKAKPNPSKAGDNSWSLRPPFSGEPLAAKH